MAGFTYKVVVYAVGDAREYVWREYRVSSTALSRLTVAR